MVKLSEEQLKKRREYQRKWYRNNPQKKVESARKYRKGNPEKCREYANKHYKKVKARNDAWNKLSDKIQLKNMWDLAKRILRGEK